jgi:hypothetical protein
MMHVEAIILQGASRPRRPQSEQGPLFSTLSLQTADVQGELGDSGVAECCGALRIPRPC